MLDELGLAIWIILQRISVQSRLGRLHHLWLHRTSHTLNIAGLALDFGEPSRPFPGLRVRIGATDNPPRKQPPKPYRPAPREFLNSRQRRKDEPQPRRPTTDRLSNDILLIALDRGRDKLINRQPPTDKMPTEAGHRRERTPTFCNNSAGANRG